MDDRTRAPATVSRCETLNGAGGYHPEPPYSRPFWLALAKVLAQSKGESLGHLVLMCTYYVVGVCMGLWDHGREILGNASNQAEAGYSTSEGK
jgi:hypothetical protein